MTISDINRVIAKEEKSLGRLLFPGFGKYWNRFQQNFKKVKEQAAPDAVHDLRVSIRRLRSMLVIFKEIAFPVEINSSRVELKNIMDIVGGLRDQHIQHNLVKKSASAKKSFLDPYLSDLNSRILKQEQNLDNMIRKARITRTISLSRRILAHKSLKLIPPKEADRLALRGIDNIVTRAILQKYLLKCFALSPLVKNEENQMEFHKLRINVKKLRYKLEILHPLILKSSWKKESDFLRSIQDCMGQTHDIDLAIENVRQYFMNNDPRKLRDKNYAAWLKNMGKKRAKLYRKSLALLKNLEKRDFFSK